MSFALRVQTKPSPWRFQPRTKESCLLNYPRISLILKGPCEICKGSSCTSSRPFSCVSVPWRPANQIHPSKVNIQKQGYWVNDQQQCSINILSRMYVTSLIQSKPSTWRCFNPPRLPSRMYVASRVHTETSTTRFQPRMTESCLWNDPWISMTINFMRDMGANALHPEPSPAFGFHHPYAGYWINDQQRCPTRSDQTIDETFSNYARRKVPWETMHGNGSQRTSSIPLTVCVPLCRAKNKSKWMTKSRPTLNAQQQCSAL